MAGRSPPHHTPHTPPIENISGGARAELATRLFSYKDKHRMQFLSFAQAA